MVLPESFYQRSNVVSIARDLLGMKLVTRMGRRTTAGIIVETEAYSQTEKGCHAFRGMTQRNQVMFQAGGIAYVYLCYGIHHLFNVVTNSDSMADAVLIRAIEPCDGVGHMLVRTSSTSVRNVGNGPGKLTRALGIDRQLNGASLAGSQVWIEDIGGQVPDSEIIRRPRIGIDYAGTDALLPWRFLTRDNPWVSKP